MFREEHFKSSIIRIAIGILIFAIIFLTSRFRDRTMLKKSDSINKKSNIILRRLLIIAIIAFLVGIYIGIVGAIPAEEWNITFGGNGSDYVYSVQQTSDRGYILAGKTSSYGSEAFDAWLIKTNENGSEEWKEYLKKLLWLFSRQWMVAIYSWGIYV